MNAKVSVFAICVEAIICLSLYSLDGYTFKKEELRLLGINQSFNGLLILVLTCKSKKNKIQSQSAFLKSKLE